jgi:glutathione S-transferase
MAQYKLYYFNFKGRGEYIRYLFAAAGHQYEDIRFERQDWPTKYKALAPLGTCPWLEITDGSQKLVLGQSMTISE